MIHKQKLDRPKKIDIFMAVQFELLYPTRTSYVIHLSLKYQLAPLGFQRFICVYHKYM